MPVRGLDTGPGGGGAHVRQCVWRGPGGALSGEQEGLTS